MIKIQKFINQYSFIVNQNLNEENYRLNIFSIDFIPSSSD